MRTNLVGSLGELQVQIKLAEMGYEVFQNITRTGPADLVVWNQNNGVMLAIDVKSERESYIRKDGTEFINVKNRAKFENGIWYIGYLHSKNEYYFPEGFFDTLDKTSGTE